MNCSMYKNTCYFVSNDVPPRVLPSECNCFLANSVKSCKGAFLWWTGEGSSVSSAAGGIKPRSIKLRIPFLASCNVKEEGNNAEQGIHAILRVSRILSVNDIYCKNT